MVMDKKHILMAQQNEALLTALDNTFLNWKYVVLYYAALHYGDSFVAKKKFINIKTHEDRKRIYRQCNMNKKAFLSYKRLEDASRTARYNPDWQKHLTESDFNDLYNNDFPLMKNLVIHS